MTLRAIAHGVGTDVTSITGTAGQITASASTGSVTLSVPDPFTPPGVVNLTSGKVLSWNSDVGLSRGSASFLYLGNGTQGDGTGVLVLGRAQTSTITDQANSGAYHQYQAAGARLQAVGRTATDVTYTVQGAAAQSANLQEWNVNGGGAVASISSTGAMNLGGSATFTAATAGIVLKRGSNGLVGTFVANGATPVTVSNTNVAITDAIIISLNTVGGTVGVQPHVSAITGGTSFAVTCTASDTSTYNYAIIKNAA